MDKRCKTVPILPICYIFNRIIIVFTEKQRKKKKKGRMIFTHIHIYVYNLRISYFFNVICESLKHIYLHLHAKACILQFNF